MNGGDVLTALPWVWITGLIVLLVMSAWDDHYDRKDNR